MAIQPNRRMIRMAAVFAVLLVVAGGAGPGGAAEPGRVEAGVRRSSPRVFLQTGTPYSPLFDIKADVVLLAGINDTFAERARQWHDKGYAVRAFNALMRVNTREYPGAAGIAQTLATGEKLDRGRGGFEIVPTLDYVEYLKTLARRAVDTPQVIAIEFEEPEFVGHRGLTGYGEAFRGEWRACYGEPWQDPDASAEALYRANKLKYHLVHRALAGAMGEAKAYARARGRSIECVVAAHSLASWVHDGTVAPFTSLCDEAFMDAYRVQVWTLTGGVGNTYQGMKKERPFETEFLEYAETANLVRPTRMRLEFDNEPLGDEDNLSYLTWKARWEPGTVASLMFPEVTGYRPIVWPQRLLGGSTLYPTPESVRKMVRAGTGAGEAALEKAPIPAHYQTEALVAVHAIGEVLAQKDFTFDSGPAGVGVLVSDAMMFQRKLRDGKADMFAYYGLMLPLLKHGLRVEPVRLEHTPRAGFLGAYKVLLLEYESQKPQKAAFNEALAAWVKAGGELLVFGDGADPFNKVREWWNQGANRYDSPRQHLFESLGLGRTPAAGVHRCGRGRLVLDFRSPEIFAQGVAAAAELRQMVRGAFRHCGAQYWEQNYFKVQRGPYVMAKVFDETPEVLPLEIPGNLIDLFDPELAVVRRRVLYPGEAAFLYDLAKVDRARPAVLASASRIESATAGPGIFSFVSAGPTETRGATRLALPAQPKAIAIKGPDGQALAFEQNWDSGSGTLFLGYPNLAEGVRVEIGF